jgi:hypothetical protein
MDDHLLPLRLDKKKHASAGPLKALPSGEKNNEGEERPSVVQESRRRPQRATAKLRASTIRYTQQAITSAMSSESNVEEREREKESKAGSSSTAEL